MHIVKVKLGRRSYDIVVGSNIMNWLGAYIKKNNLGDHAYIITNPLVRKKYANLVSGALKKSGFSFTIKSVPDTEKSKSIAILSAVVGDLARTDPKKRIFIIALGGGVVGDLSGFVASIYKRGVAYIQIPTTLLAQVDSAIGGKTAVDLKEGKNLIGAFYQPALVFSDVSLLKSLDSRQIRAGLAEVIKYGIIKDKSLFAYLEKNLKDIFKHKPRALEYIVKRTSAIKAGIVSRDEKEEKSLRTILNFGHTIGHAIEAATGFSKYTHGEAVGLGMLIAVEISRRLGLIGADLPNRIERLIIKAGLPVKISGASLKSIIKASLRDKKFIGAKNRFVLISGLGKTRIVENIPLSLIEEALGRRMR